MDSGGRVTVPALYPSLMPLGAVLTFPAWYGFPSGLVIPAYRLNWVWAFPGARRPTDYFIGAAEQAEKAARGWKIDPTAILAVHEDDIHGTCVREDLDGRGQYQLVQAHSFPRWCGV